MNFPFLSSYYFAHFQTSIRDLHNSEIPILLLRSCSTSSEIQTNGRRKKVTKNFFPSFSFRSWIYLVARIFRSQAIEFRRSTCKEYEHTNSRDIRERDSKFEKWRIRERERWREKVHLEGRCNATEIWLHKYTQVEPVGVQTRVFQKQTPQSYSGRSEAKVKASSSIASRRRREDNRRIDSLFLASPPLARSPPANESSSPFSSASLHDE